MDLSQQTLYSKMDPSLPLQTQIQMDLSLSPRPPPQRIVLLIDLLPLLQNPNPNPNSNHPYITYILSSIRAILAFPPLSSSLFSSRLFISSLSPLLSSSLLPPSPPLLSFHLPGPTLSSLSHTLHSLFLRPLVGPTTLPNPNPSLLANFLLQLLHDYPWDHDDDDDNSSQTRSSFVHFPQILPPRSNLVLLFSPAYPDFNNFRRILGPVNQKLVARDIQVSWIHVNLEGGCNDLEVFEKGIRELGWGFSSAEAIVLGSALVPFGLIFPYIGCSMRLGNGGGSFEKGRAELFLGIRDVSGKPLECKSCELEVVEMKLVKEGLRICDRGVVKIRVREIWRKEEEVKVVEKSIQSVLLRAVDGECRKEGGDCEKDSVADRVLRLFCREKGEFAEGKPIWQLLLAFLSRGNCYASVSISCADGSSFDGIIKPFTINYASLSIIEKRNLDSCH